MGNPGLLLNMNLRLHLMVCRVDVTVSPLSGVTALASSDLIHAKLTCFVHENSWRKR